MTKQEQHIRPNEWQVVITGWEESCQPNIGLADRIDGFVEEAGELLEACACGDEEEIANEAGDALVRLVSIIDSCGSNVEEQLHRIMQQNYRKYNPVKAEKLREEGNGEKEAMGVMKEEWELNGYTQKVMGILDNS